MRTTSLRLNRKLQGLSHFFGQVGSLKDEPRRGWLLKLGLKNPESVADHSYRLAIMAMVYGDLRGLDTLKMIRLALLHDLPEALTGDVTPLETSRYAIKINEEQKAIEEIFQHLPSDLKKNYSDVWGEWSGKRTSEARLVSQLDKLEMAIQATEYGKRGHSLEKLLEFFSSAEAAVTDKELRNLVRNIRESMLRR